MLWSYHWITCGCFLTAQTHNKRSPNDSLLCRLWPRLLRPVLWIFGTHMNILVFFFPAGPKPCRLFPGHTLKCYILGSSWVRGKAFRQGMGLEREKEQMSLKLLVSVTLDLGILTAPQPNASTIPTLRVWKPAQEKRWLTQCPSDGNGRHWDQNLNLRGSGNLDGKVESTGGRMGFLEHRSVLP